MEIAAIGRRPRLDRPTVAVLLVASVGLMALASTTSALGGEITEESLRDAIVASDVERAREVLEAGADRSLSAGCDQGCTGPGGNALAWALELGRDDLVPLLQD